MKITIYTLTSDTDNGTNSSAYLSAALRDEAHAKLINELYQLEFERSPAGAAAVAMDMTDMEKRNEHLWDAGVYISTDCNVQEIPCEPEDFMAWLLANQP